MASPLAKCNDLATAKSAIYHPQTTLLCFVCFKVCEDDALSASKSTVDFSLLARMFFVGSQLRELNFVTALGTRHETERALIGLVYS